MEEKEKRKEERLLKKKQKEEEQKRKEEERAHKAAEREEKRRRMEEEKIHRATERGWQQEVNDLHFVSEQLKLLPQLMKTMQQGVLKNLLQVMLMGALYERSIGWVLTV